MIKQMQKTSTEELGITSWRVGKVIHKELWKTLKFDYTTEK